MNKPLALAMGLNVISYLILSTICIVGDFSNPFYFMVPYFAIAVALGHYMDEIYATVFGGSSE